MLHEGDKAIGASDFGLGDLKRNPAPVQNDEPLRNIEYMMNIVTDEQN